MPRFFCIELSFEVLERIIKVAPDDVFRDVIMKIRKRLFSLLVAIFCINSFIYASGYEKSIEINCGVGLNKFSKYSLGVEMINGFRFNDYFAVGVGVGFRYTNALYYHSYQSSNHQSTTYDSYDGKYLIPLHARVKANLSSAKVSPFLMLDGGYTFDVGKNPNKNTEGLFFEPAIGVDIKLDDVNSIYFGVGVNLQNSHYQYFSIGGYSGSYDSVEKGLASTLNFRIGFSF